MSTAGKALAVLILGASLSACVSHGPDGVAYSDDRSKRVGATLGGAGGEVKGAAPEEKEQRGNTPPGLDRDGHGPAAGAIVDPTGAATRKRPY
jgi:hypothetical protein